MTTLSASASAMSTTSAPERIFAALCSSSARDRSTAAGELADLLEEKHSTEYHRRVGELIASAEPRKCAGGLAAISALMMIDGDDLGPRLSTYGAPLRVALLRSFSSNADDVWRACEQHYGELVRRGRDPDALEAETRCALEALSDEMEPNGGSGGARLGEKDATPEARLLVALLSLRQLTTHASAAVYPQTVTALELLWKALTYRSSRVRMRVCARASPSKARACHAVRPRPSTLGRQWVPWCTCTHGAMRRVRRALKCGCARDRECAKISLPRLLRLRILRAGPSHSSATAAAGALLVL